MTENTTNGARRKARALHPTRVAIIRALRAGEASPSDVARTIGETVGAVAYHARTLRDDGLIAASRTVMRRGAIETYYRLTPAGHRQPEALADVAREAAEYLEAGCPVIGSPVDPANLARRLRRALPKPTTPTTRKAAKR